MTFYKAIKSRKVRKCIFNLGYCAIAIGFSVCIHADTIKVAVASNFTAPMKELAQSFEKQFDHTLALSFASSGKFYAQISHGAPYHVFLSADQVKPQALIEKGLAIKETQFTYAIGVLALWGKDSKLNTQNGEALKTDSFRWLAIANPRLAPYGAAALQTLSTLGVKEKLKNNIVEGENITQAFQYVHTGNAQLGLVALSQLIAMPTSQNKRFWIVPETFHDPILQDAVLLTSAKNLPAAHTFLTFLRTPAAQNIISEFGYRLEP